MSRRNTNMNGFRIPTAIGVIMISMSLCGIVSAWEGSATTPYTWTDELPALVNDDALANGLWCTGGYCSALALDYTTDNIVLTDFDKWAFTWTVEFSDQMNGGQALCPNGAFVTGLVCYGDWCAVKELQCTQMYKDISTVPTPAVWDHAPVVQTPTISEETGGGNFNHVQCAVAGEFIVGMQASGYYSDNMTILCAGMN